MAACRPSAYTTLHLLSPRLIPCPSVRHSRHRPLVIWACKHDNTCVEKCTISLRSPLPSEHKHIPTVLIKGKSGYSPSIPINTMKGVSTGRIHSVVVRRNIPFSTIPPNKVYQNMVTRTASAYITIVPSIAQHVIRPITVLRERPCFDLTK